MSSTQQDSNDLGHSRGQKVDKQSRLYFSPKEELVLLASLKELVASGWKSDNGFKPPYLIKLAEAMAKEFPGTDLKASPHINSKLQTWKKNYGSLCTITARSGIGFNVNGNHQIDCSDDQWKQIVKCDANAKTMRHKSWPMFEDWKEIFGKDRATGEGAQDFMDAINVAMHGDNLAGDKNVEGDYYHPNLDDVYVDDVEEKSTCHSDKHESVNKSSNKGKKRKAADPVEGLTDVFLSIGRGTNERLDKIASRIGYEYDRDQAKKESFALLKDISGLTLDQKFEVCEIFADKTDRPLIFKGLPDDTRAQYVQRLLIKKPT